jgi:hypothetical protein
MTPDLTALFTSDRKRKLGEVGFNTIGSPRIADNLRTGIASPLLARSEAVHFRGSSCPIIYTKTLVLSVCSLPRIPYPQQIIRFRGQLKDPQKMSVVKFVFGPFVCKPSFGAVRRVVLAQDKFV